MGCDSGPESPLAVQMAKKAFYAAADMEYFTSLEYMTDTLSRLCTSEGHRRRDKCIPRKETTSLEDEVRVRYPPFIPHVYRHPLEPRPSLSGTSILRSLIFCTGCSRQYPDHGQQASCCRIASYRLGYKVFFHTHKAHRSHAIPEEDTAGRSSEGDGAVR